MENNDLLKENENSFCYKLEQIMQLEGLELLDQLVNLLQNFSQNSDSRLDDETIIESLKDEILKSNSFAHFKRKANKKEYILALEERKKKWKILSEKIDVLIDRIINLNCDLDITKLINQILSNAKINYLEDLINSTRLLVNNETFKQFLSTSNVSKQSFSIREAYFDFKMKVSKNIGLDLNELAELTKKVEKEIDYLCAYATRLNQEEDHTGDTSPEGSPRARLYYRMFGKAFSDREHPVPEEVWKFNNKSKESNEEIVEMPHVEAPFLDRFIALFRRNENDVEPNCQNLDFLENQNVDADSNRSLNDELNDQNSANSSDLQISIDKPIESNTIELDKEEENPSKNSDLAVNQDGHIQNTEFELFSSYNQLTNHSATQQTDQSSSSKTILPDLNTNSEPGNNFRIDLSSNSGRFFTDQSDESVVKEAKKKSKKKDEEDDENADGFNQKTSLSSQISFN